MINPEGSLICFCGRTRVLSHARCYCLGSCACGFTRCDWCGSTERAYLPYVQACERAHGAAALEAIRGESMYTVPKPNLICGHRFYASMRRGTVKVYEARNAIVPVATLTGAPARRLFDDLLAAFSAIAVDLACEGAAAQSGTVCGSGERVQVAADGTLFVRAPR